MSLTSWAFELAETYLAESLPLRWKHVQGVARKARSLHMLAGPDADLLEASAVVHDIGYSPALVDTGFHPIDGARFLASIDAPVRLVNLVAHHSFAALEAELRSLSSAMAQFHDEEGVIRDALWYCDQTTTPDGTPTTIAARHAEIQERYGPRHVVTTFIQRGGEALTAAGLRTEERLQGLA